VAEDSLSDVDISVEYPPSPVDDEEDMERVREAMRRDPSILARALEKFAKKNKKCMQRKNSSLQ
jgi:hypothetical protein